MSPVVGERVLRFVGDRLEISIRPGNAARFEGRCRAFLRTNLGRADRLRHEIIHAHTGRLGLAAGSWRDIPMSPHDGGWRIDLALAEVGFYKAKAYVVDEHDRQHWPDGRDLGISVHPDQYRTGNTIYCAFTRMFGPTRKLSVTEDEEREAAFEPWDRQGYAVIPPSGTFRDLARQLPHIIDTLGCRILHLLPVNPTPTTFARFGRFGSPYACQDLLAIDPALAEFDKCSTAVDQFRELTYAVHLKNGRVFLDVVINHTGWGSTLWENHPEWFVRKDDGTFISPGAWGVTWEDLVELHHVNPKLWEHIGDVFLEWCRRGVDGFRCDAGYKIPVPAWQYITARVLAEFPETIFLLEGLGGSWKATENLLTEGGMQWAYSELFQNYSGEAVAGYLDYSHRQSASAGLYIHYSETHDNDRLSKKGRAWSLLRNRLCALASASGGFGFTCGVEWLAPEKINVHQSRGLAWNQSPNIVPELAELNRLLAEHPCFFDGADLRRLSAPDSPVYALLRVSAEGSDRMLVLVNTDEEKEQTWDLDKAEYLAADSPDIDLLSGDRRKPKSSGKGKFQFRLAPGAAWCLANSKTPHGLFGAAYRLSRARAAWGLACLSAIHPCEQIGPCDWQALAELVDRNPETFLSAIDILDEHEAHENLHAALEKALAQHPFPSVVAWRPDDARRILLVPPGHWLLIREEAPFRARLSLAGQDHHIQSVATSRGHIACFKPGLPKGDASLELERFGEGSPRLQSTVRYLEAEPCVSDLRMDTAAVAEGKERPHPSGLVLLTNGRGGMARLYVDLGTVKSKYDCLLGANLHPHVPVDRHIFVKRVRLWVVADGFITQLNGDNLIGFTPGPPAEWRFVANAGDGRAVEIHMIADMLPDRNTTLLRFVRPNRPPAYGTSLPENRRVALTVRPDLLDRNFHFESVRNEDAERHFAAHLRNLDDRPGFAFAPADDRRLEVWSDTGKFHAEPEWSLGLEHPVETSRGQTDHEDSFSPGWFEVPLSADSAATLVFCADPEPPSDDETRAFPELRRGLIEEAEAKAHLSEEDEFGRRLCAAIQSFVAKRNDARTVIAGYPWFLDWGRDSLICARGMIAAGLREEVRQLLVAFGRFEENGTLPNSIHGEDASNRETSDAPLWYGIVAEELAAVEGDALYDTPVDRKGRTIREVLIEIGRGYFRGTPHGIRRDPESGLIWSPSHFTWMDTNYPAGTPRQGYPVEIQALWIRLCRQLETLRAESAGMAWKDAALQARDSLRQYYWMEDRGYFADTLVAKPEQAASQSIRDDALRSNLLLTISLGLADGDMARRSVDAAARYLVVPGALRSLAPLPVSPPLPIRHPDGPLLNDPENPYWGRYEGDEDTRRKPAYHNGTAWTWTFPSFCEALAAAWSFEPAALRAARAYLGSMDRLMLEGCLGHLPEILDGDAPHAQRGCDAQAWSATEALRVWKLLLAKEQRTESQTRQGKTTSRSSVV